MARSKAPNISDLKNRVELCSMRDTVEDLATMALQRVKVFGAWAAITPKAGSMWSPDGYSIRESREKRSHLATIRYRADIDITSAAWVYEERLKSPPRWYKILSVTEVEENGRWWVLELRAVERSEDISSPVAKVDGDMSRPMPDGVRL